MCFPCAFAVICVSRPVAHIRYLEEFEKKGAFGAERWCRFRTLFVPPRVSHATGTLGRVRQLVKALQNLHQCCRSLQLLSSTDLLISAQAIAEILSHGVQHGTPDDEIYSAIHRCIWVTHAPEKKQQVAQKDQQQPSTQSGSGAGAANGIDGCCGCSDARRPTNDKKRQPDTFVHTQCYWVSAKPRAIAVLALIGDCNVCMHCVPFGLMYAQL